MSRNKLDETADLFLSVIPLIKKAVIHSEKPHNDLVILRTQYPVLSLLKNSGTLNMSDVCNSLCVSKPQMTVLVDRLIKEGKIERVQSETDRRVILISLTNKGKIFLTETRSSISAMIKNNLNKLDQNDLQSLNKSLENMQLVLSKLGEQKQELKK